MSSEKTNINGLHFTKDPFITQYLKQKAQPDSGCAFSLQKTTLTSYKHYEQAVSEAIVSRLN